MTIPEVLLSSTEKAAIDKLWKKGSKVLAAGFFTGLTFVILSFMSLGNATSDGHTSPLAIFSMVVAVGATFGSIFCSGKSFTRAEQIVPCIEASEHVRNEVASIEANLHLLPEELCRELRPLWDEVKDANDFLLTSHEAVDLDARLTARERIVKRAAAVEELAEEHQRRLEVAALQAETAKPRPSLSSSDVGLEVASVELLSTQEGNKKLGDLEDSETL